MASYKKFAKSLVRLILPLLLVCLLALVSASIWLVHDASNAPKSPYLVTPEKIAALSPRGAKTTDETWQNKDNTTARGWLLRGSKNAPAVILLHRYGTDRSWVFNLGVKLNEVTNYTVLMPDLRGHGENPLVRWTSFGSTETEDLQAAIDFLHSVKNSDSTPLIGKSLGLYGVELGAYIALNGAAENADVKALAVDSVPPSADELLKKTVKSRLSFGADFSSQLAEYGARVYYQNNFSSVDLCGLGAKLSDRRILLLAGADESTLQSSTTNLAACFQNQSGIQTKFSLTPSGFNNINSNGQQEDAYDQNVIEFFQTALSAN